MVSKRSYHLVILLLILSIAIMSIISLCVGRFSMNPLDALGAVQTKLYGGEIDNTAMENVLFVLRLPRVIGALLIGACLSLSGVVYQSVFKNPLVSPDILGVSSGACVGAATAILFGLSVASCQAVAFAAGIFAVTCAVLIPKIMRNESNLMLVLSGTIVSGFMSSILGLLKFVAEENTELSSIIYWQMGSIQSIKMHTISHVLPVFAICASILLLLSWRLNILSFGDNEAKTLGVNLTVLRFICIVTASMMTASAVCISGTIGWIGLVIPHLGRLCVGSDNTKLVPVSMLLGGLFLLVIDTLARTVTTLEIPLSILTGLVGAPVYAWLLWKQKAKVM